MSVIDIEQGERGVVRVFSLSMDANAAKQLRASAAGDGGEGPGPIEAALGARGIDTNFVEVFPVADVAEIGLDRYLEEGPGIEPAQIDPDRRKLTSLDGWLLLVYSAAFGGRGARLGPAPELTLVGTYSEPGVDWSEKTRLTSAATESAPAAPEKKPPSEAAVSGRVALVVLLVLFLLTAVVIWIAA